MLESWRVDFKDKDEDGVQTASFASKRDADVWVMHQEDQERYDPSGFELVDGPYQSNAPLPKEKVKVWIGTEGPIEDGFHHVKSLDEFVYFFASIVKKLEDIGLVSLGDDVRLARSVIVWLDNHGAEDVYVHFHGNSPASKKAVEDAASAVGFHIASAVNENLKRALTEGKHWPEDYIKTAFNLIKQSPIGQQSWYSDNYIKQDVDTFVNEFAPLSHKSSNLGFFMAIIRWFIEYSGTSKEKYQDFIERKLDSIIAALLKIRNDKSYDAMAEQIKKMPFADFMKLIKEVNQKTSNDGIVAISNASFKVIPIYSYEELNEKYGGPLTGYKSESKWCHTNGKSTYDSWTKDGTQMFFVIEAENWQEVKAPEQKPKNCYDEYGMSLIAILVDVQSNKLLNSTSRWNHVVLPASGAADTMFETWQQLDKAVGLDVERICREECIGLKEKLDKASEDANAEAVEILKNAKIITNVTLPKDIKKHVTYVVVPDSIESIGDWAFNNCTSLKNIDIPESVKSIGGYAFWNCTSLTSIEIPANVESIGDWAFWKCMSLTSIEIPNSVKSIGYKAFADCTTLKDIDIPKSVKRIGNWAFDDCKSLTSIIFKGKTINQVKAMKWYPWGIKDESVIKCEANLDENMDLAMCNRKTKIWVDDIRPAPNGYIWLKSVDDFIDWMVEHGLQDVLVIDLDHDAGDYALDGGDYIKCLDWLESVGVEDVNVRVHSANPVGIAKMRQVIKKNGWTEVFDIYDEQPSLDEQELDEAGIQDQKLKVPKQKKSSKKNSKKSGPEDTKSKRTMVDKLKDIAQEFKTKANNNDPEQFAKISVAFDDLASAVGDYDFKQKKVLNEIDIDESEEEE